MWPSRPPDGGPLREPSFPVKKSHFPSLGSDRGNRFNCRRGAADEDELPACLASIKNADENLSRIRKAVADFGLANTTDSFVTADHGFATISNHAAGLDSAAATVNVIWWR